MTYHTRFCTRIFPEIPHSENNCGCIDCRIIRGLRRTRFQGVLLHRVLRFVFGFGEYIDDDGVTPSWK